MNSPDVQFPPWGLGVRLRLLSRPCGLAVLAHGIGPSHMSPRNVAVSESLSRSGFATLSFDLVLAEGERDRRKLSKIDLLAERLIAAVQWIGRRCCQSNFPMRWLRHFGE